MIVRDCTILLKSDSATLSETLVLYKGDQNIEYTFTLKDNAYKFSNGTDGNIVTQLEASYAQILWYKNAEIRITFPIQETNDGKVVLKITKELIDEDNEMGDYDFQIRLYDSNKEAILTLPPLLKAVHIKAPLFEKDPLVDLASADVSTLVTAGPEETIYGTDGNYLKTTWVPGMIITSAKLNKIETALYDACRTKTAGDISLTDTSGNFTSDNVEGALSEINSQIKDIAKDLLLEDGKLYLKKSDGTKLGTGVVLPVSGSGGSITWENVTGKPATFTPSSHKHSKSEITDFPTIPTVSNDLTNALKANYDSAYTHSTSTHAPVNAQKNSDITKDEIEAKLTGEIVTHTHPGMITAKSYVTYEEFGAKSDGVNDDGVAIKLAHEHANQNNLTVKPDSTKTYYIKQAHSIPIINSTDLNNATFVIDDTVEVDRKKNVFEVKSKKEPITIVDLNFTVKRSTVKLSNLSGHGLCLVQVVNANKKQFIREGSNSNEGTDQQDYFVIDNEGSVLTDIIWDFEQITSCTLYPFDDTTLIMKNAKFITRSNGKELQTNYFDRGLTVNRSNVILENISHRVENEQPGSPYHGFISGRYCAYLTLKNCSVQSRKAYKVSGTSVWMGSYDIEMYCVVGVKLENVIDVTFDNKERWGVFASNFCKDIVVEDSTLSRVDAHQGARNITIRRSVIGNQGIRVIGSGLCLIEDSKILNSMSLITLRNDYGSSWEGILVIKRTYWKPDTTYAYPRIINFANASNHDFGYTCYFPRLIIDDLDVDDTELLSNDSYTNIPIINNNTAVFGTDITSFTHPYHFTDNIECKNMRTRSDKGFILFNSSTINLYNKNPFTYKVLESTSGNDKKLLIIPNTKIVLDNVKLAKVSRRMNASGNLFAILDASGNDGDGFTNNVNHVLPLIHIKNCENVYAFTSNHPMVLELEDSVVSTLLNVGASTRMNGKATGCSFKPSIDGVYQSVNTNYGDFAFTDCKFDTPLVNSVEEKTPTNLVRIYSFLGSYDSAKNNYNLINTIMDNCSIWDGTRCLALGTISDTGVSNALLTEYTGGKKQRFMTQREYDSLSSTGQLDSNTVYNITDAPAGIVIKKVTQQQYDSESHDTNTLYIIVG